MAAVLACGEGAALSHRSAAELWALLRPQDGPIHDLGGTVPSRQWRRAVRQAELAGYRLGPKVETDGTRSDLEGDFLRICRRAGLPAPEVNVRRGRSAFQDDHARELDLRQLGFELRRFDERQIEEEPERVATDLKETLGGRR